MERDAVRALLRAVAAGEAPIEEALEALAAAPVGDLGFASVDHHRALRAELPEVVLAAGKTPAEVVAIARAVFERAGRVLITRLEPAHLAAVRAEIPLASIHERAGLAWLDPQPRPRRGDVVVVTAGTSDIPVAEEAALTAEIAGTHVTRIVDVGVAGLHRLLPHIPALRRANVVVVVAGMDGALASVVGGLVSNPVVAVPVSTGYGAAFGGLAPLLAMLNSCAAGVAVMNIDNGFGAGCMAAMINRLAVDGPLGETPRGEGANA